MSCPGGLKTCKKWTVLKVGVQKETPNSKIHHVSINCTPTTKVCINTDNHSPFHYLERLSNATSSHVFLGLGIKLKKGESNLM